MVDSTTNLNTSFTNALNNVLATSDGSIDELHAINQAILSGEGIDQIIEAFAEENPEFAKALKNNKNEIKKPDVELSQLMDLDIEIPKELAEKLGLAGKNVTNEKIAVNIGTFRQAALQECLKESEKKFGLGNLNSETIDLLCLLLCQDSKTQIINTLKETLKSKVAERAKLSEDYQVDQKEIVKNEIEAMKEAEKAKIMSIFSAVLSVVISIAVTAASIAFTVLTGGTGVVIAVAAVAGALSVVAAIASSACTIAAIETDDPDTKEKLNTAALGLGIASAVIGLIGGGVEIFASIAFAPAKVGANAAMAVAKGAGQAAAKETAKAAGKAAAEAAETAIKTATKEATKEGLEALAKEAAKEAAKGAAKEAAKELGEELSEELAEEMAEAAAKAVTKKLIKGDFAKFAEKISTIVTVGGTVIQGATQIGTGALNIESANTQKELAEIKIEMAKLDQEIETLVAFIDALTQDIQKFMEDYLKNEQEAAEALQAKGDIELQLSQKTA